VGNAHEMFIGRYGLDEYLRTNLQIIKLLAKFVNILLEMLLVSP
jgi:hypothetical protein